MVVLLLVAAKSPVLFKAQDNYDSLARDAARLISRHSTASDDVDAYLASRAVVGAPPMTP